VPTLPCELVAKPVNDEPAPTTTVGCVVIFIVRVSEPTFVVGVCTVVCVAVDVAIVAWEPDAPMVILDVGHNEDGIKQIIQQLELTSYHELHIILGMVKDKEIYKVLSLFPHNAFYYFTQAAIPRALPAKLLQSKAAEYNLKGEIFINVNEAITSAKAKAHKDDLIIVCGSVFLVGEVNPSVH